MHGEHHDHAALPDGVAGADFQLPKPWTERRYPVRGPHGTRRPQRIREEGRVADALRFVANALRTGIEAAITERHGIVAVRRWSAGRPFDVSIRLEVTGPTSTGHYEFVLGDRKGGYRVKHESAHWTSLDSSAGYEVVEGHWKSGPNDLRPSVSDLALVLPLVAGDARFRPLADALRNVENTHRSSPIRCENLRSQIRPSRCNSTERTGVRSEGHERGVWAPELRAAPARSSDGRYRRRAREADWRISLR